MHFSDLNKSITAPGVWRQQPHLRQPSLCELAQTQQKVLVAIWGVRTNEGQRLLAIRLLDLAQEGS